MSIESRIVWMNLDKKWYCPIDWNLYPINWVSTKVILKRLWQSLNERKHLWIFYFPLNLNNRLFLGLSINWSKVSINWLINFGPRKIIFSYHPPAYKYRIFLSQFHIKKKSFLSHSSLSLSKNINVSHLKLVVALSRKEYFFLIK